MSVVTVVVLGLCVTPLCYGQTWSPAAIATIRPNSPSNKEYEETFTTVGPYSYDENDKSFVCDFCLYDGEGNFSSYDYPVPYRKNLDCSYRVKRVDDSCHLEITFHEFDVPSTGACINDYLLINGNRYCGSQWKGKAELIPFYPELEEITFKFHTDNEISGRGFWLQVKRQANTCLLASQESCNRTYAGEEFALRSPNFPNNYENSQECSYNVIKHSKDTCGLEFTFLAFNVEPSDNCTYDYLEVGSKKLCGPVTSNAVRVFMFSDDEMHMRFKSDNQNARSGFNIKVRQITKCYSSKLDTSPSSPSPPLCNIRSKGISGEISSWGYPLGYANNLVCQYTITKSNDDYCQVELEFQNFDVDFTIGCTADYLQAGNQKYCGTSLRRQKKTLQFDAMNNVILLFRTDQTSTKKGFKFKYKQIPCTSPSEPITVQPNACIYVFDQKEFFLRSPNYPMSYNNNNECQYVIKRQSTKICAVEVKFNFFDVESSTNCSKDYLDVSGEKYCGKYTSKIIRTFPFQTMDKVITFHSDFSNTKAGFFLHVVQQECDVRSAAITGDDCNQEIRETEFELKSPGYPSQYRGDLSCQYVVYRSDDNICDLVVSVQDFQLQEGEVCENDYLQIGEERLCGTIDFGTVRAYDFGNQDQIVFSFETDRTSHGRGFLLNAIQRNCNSTDQPLFSTTVLPFRAVSQNIKCDRVIRGTEDTLFSPQYPNRYPDGIDCRYDVNRVSDRYCELEITINNLHIQVGDSCQFDYLEVDGHRFCGSTTAGNKRIFTFKSNRILINFHSDNSVNDRGFEVTVKQRECLPPTDLPQTGGCNEVFSSPEFIMTSPGFPGDYENGVSCRYTIRRSKDNVCKLEMSFIAFDVESSSNCEYDYLEINGEKICGIMENVTRTYLFQNYEKVITFRSDSGTARPGFMIRVVQQECAGQSTDFPMTLKPCNQQFNTPTFQIRSDNYPNNYESNLNCIYKIVRNNRNICSLDINFLAFDVEASDGCQYDYLEIEGEKLCGVYPSSLKRNIKFESEEMNFKFRSDGATSRPGFHLQVQQVDCSLTEPGGCDQVFNNVSGILSSPQYPHKYPPDVRCTYTFTAQPNHCRLQLNFLEFGLQTESSLCQQDYLEINKIRYCGPQLLSQTRTLTFYGTPREILMEFKSDGTLDDKGFYATFKQLPCAIDAGRSKLPRRPPKGAYVSSCDRLYASLSFQILSPGYPNTYPDDKDCRYTIRRLNQKVCKLQFTFEHFNIEASENCDYDYLEVNGERLCGTFPEGTIRVFDVRDYQTVVLFHSDDANTRPGFIIRVLQLDCQPKQQGDTVLPARDSHPPLVIAQPPSEEQFGYSQQDDYEQYYDGPPQGPPQNNPFLEHSNGFDFRNCDRTFYKEHFEIRSVNFPNNYPNSLNCRYIIIKAHENICWVKLSFIRFDVETSDDCQFDYLSINGKRICGTLPEDDIRAYIFTSDEISMYFRSDAATPHRGFLIKGEQLQCRPNGGPPPVGPNVNQPMMSSPCDQTFDKDLFVIQSPGFPGSYPDGVECQYHVRKSNKYICGLEMTVLSFEIEDDEECHKDFLFFGDEKLCGVIPSKTVRTMTFEEPETTITFRSNEANTGPGFSILVKQYEGCTSQKRSVVSTCQPQVFNAEKFVFSSPLFPEDYPDNSSCEYRVEKSSSNVCGLELMILSFDVEDKFEGKCQNDYLQIGEQNKLCGQLPKGYKLQVHFNAQSVNFVFRSDFTTERPGFSIQVDQITNCEASKSDGERGSQSPSSSNCDATFDTPEFSLRSPDFPNDYPHNINCTYTIFPHSPDVCSLELWFAHFDIEEGPECSYDYFDLGSKRICGKLPSGFSRVINMDGASKKFTFRSDKGTSKTGFAIKVRQIANCGTGSTWKPVTPPPTMCNHCLKESRSHLTSPSYPDDYVGNLNCSYRIERASGFCGLELYFHDFHLEQSQNCSKDALVINKERFCGLELKRQIKKLNFPMNEPTEIVLRFTTDLVNSATGFHAEYRQTPCRGHPWRPDRGASSTENDEPLPSSWIPINRTASSIEEPQSDSTQARSIFRSANDRPYQYSRYSYIPYENITSLKVRT